ncbi:LOW QUALITY PROTEIN: E3 ubiquitin-protein ligase PHF7-like [Larus michahellis]|uniref:LOW QUALITY PROTEIN: E3 ubiquitin-protein ligase PHF7-like n=1 Tax=Larus michahellis TaxID=119627 RepID=UPI003D9AF522
MREICTRRGLAEFSPVPRKEIPAIPSTSGTNILLPGAPPRLQHRSLLRQAQLRAVTQPRPHPAPCPEVWGAVEALRLLLMGLLCSFQYCFVCGESGATITCRETGCERSFHLPCAVEGGCVTQYFELYRAFCWEHRPEQAVEAAPEENTTCLICLEPVGYRKSYGTMVCPACKHAWFHRGCIQAHAIHVGYFSFCCPLCRNEHRFMMEMLNMGIRIPKSLPSWQGGQADAGLRARHSRCDASVCLCPGGREQAEEGGPWELLLCSSCAAEGTHRHCSSLSSSTASWECDSCAGLGTGKRQSTRVPGGQGPGEAWQSLSAPGGSPALNSGSRSSIPGPVRMRERSRVQRRAQIPYSRPGRRRRTSRAVSLSAGPDPPPSAQ